MKPEKAYRNFDSLNKEVDSKSDTNPNVVFNSLQLRHWEKAHTQLRRNMTMCLI